MLQSTGHSFLGNASNTAFLNEAFRKESLSQAKWKSKYEQKIQEFRSPHADSDRTVQAQRRFLSSIGGEPQTTPIGFQAALASNPLEQRTYGRKKLVDTQFFDREGIPLFEERSRLLNQAAVSGLGLNFEESSSQVAETARTNVTDFENDDDMPASTGRSASPSKASARSNLSTATSGLHAPRSGSPSKSIRSRSPSRPERSRSPRKSERLSRSRSPSKGASRSKSPIKVRRSS
mmetsp:Transcript_2020/g.7252  ORF Transcript_2020/g.7252 Transcript_2020/m.7252 type:complete len:234 (-) Transcript_2020:2251-2952(-)